MEDRGILERYHIIPGQTPEMMQPWKDEHGRSSYEVVVDHVAGLSRRGNLLDVCCGDGFLLSKLKQRRLDSLVGLDQSPHELEAARRRLGSEVRLCRGDARTMPFETNAFDIIVSHMAMMLITPIEDVLAEIARVARPGAHVAIMINRPIENETYKAFRYYLHRTTKDAGLERLRLGDARMFDPDELRTLFGRPLFDPDSLCITDSEVEVRVPGAALWSYLSPMYDVYRLPETARLKLERDVLRHWATLADAQGMVRCLQGTRLLGIRTEMRSTLLPLDVRAHRRRRV